MCVVWVWVCGWMGVGIFVGVCGCVVCVCVWVCGLCVCVCMVLKALPRALSLQHAPFTAHALWNPGSILILPPDMPLNPHFPAPPR